MEKRLYKINRGKMVDGVCGGIAEYFGLDHLLRHGLQRHHRLHPLRRHLPPGAGGILICILESIS